MIALLALAAGLILGAFTVWFASAMRDLGPQPVSTPRLTPLILRPPSPPRYEARDLPYAMQARERLRLLAWDSMWPWLEPHEWEFPAGSFAAVSA